MVEASYDNIIFPYSFLHLSITSLESDATKMKGGVLHCC